MEPLQKVGRRNFRTKEPGSPTNNRALTKHNLELQLGARMQHSGRKDYLMPRGNSAMKHGLISQQLSTRISR